MKFWFRNVDIINNNFHLPRNKYMFKTRNCMFEKKLKIRQLHISCVSKSKYINKPALNILNLSSYVSFINLYAINTTWKYIPNKKSYVMFSAFSLLIVLSFSSLKRLVSTGPNVPSKSSGSNAGW